MSFTVLNLSENQADCFLIILENSAKEQITILVDGNKEYSDYQKVQKTIDNTCKKLDFIVVSHVDDDHLGGIIKMLEDDNWESAKDSKILYNHVAKGSVNYEQAKTFEELIKGRTIISSYADDYPGGCGFLEILSETDRKLCREMEKNKNAKAYLTLIKPKNFNLDKVRADCKRVLAHEKNANAKLINRNSLVFLLEFEGKSAIFTGDANWKQIEKKLGKILPPNYIMNMIKIPHHGAMAENMELTTYANTHGTKYFLVTGKEQWDNSHPNKKLIIEISQKCPEADIYTLVEGIPGKNIRVEKGCNIEK